MKKKKKLFLCIILMGLVAVTAIGSYSYMQKKNSVTNKFTIGYNSCEIVESFTKPSSLTAGTTIYKDVKIKNTGSVPCYVRVLVVPSGNPNSYRVNAISCDNNYQSGSNWYFSGNRDTYYYYKKVLQPGESTPSLFSTVTVLSDLSGASSDDSQIVVYAESSQSEGFSSCWNAFN